VIILVDDHLNCVLARTVSDISRILDPRSLDIDTPIIEIASLRSQ